MSDVVFPVHWKWRAKQYTRQFREPLVQLPFGISCCSQILPPKEARLNK